MKKLIMGLVLAVFSLQLCGCSVPAREAQKQIYSYTRQEKKIPGTFGKKRVSVKDFRGVDMYEEDMIALKDDAEKFIAIHPELSEENKNNLRQLKVAAGETQAEVELLLGKPDKLIRSKPDALYGADQIWVYKISKIRAFTVFIVPVLFVHEGYYLYFKDGILQALERHHLKQMVEQGAGPGVYEKEITDDAS